LIIAVLKETSEHEKRVALSPDVVRQLNNEDLQIWIEKDAGLPSNFRDDTYKDAGVVIIHSNEELLTK